MYLKIEWVLGLVLLFLVAAHAIEWFEIRERPGVPQVIQAGMMSRFADFSAEQPGGKSVILSTSTTCPFSINNISLYRNLSDWAARDSRRLFVVVSDESPDDVDRWLRTHGITASRVVGNIPVSEQGIVATPTVVTVNEDGIATGVLVGALSPSEEESFLALLFANRGVSMNNFLDPPMVGSDMFESLASDDSVVALDVRNRVDYRIRHDPRAVNIPVDELGIRGRIELAGFRKVFVDCRVGHSGDCWGAARGLVLDGFHGVVVVVP